MDEPEILFEQRGRLGLITLNRPKALNALTWNMVKLLDAQLDEWAEDDSIAVVAIQGAGDKAFAAGGDIRWLYDNGQGGATGDRNFRFFWDEYRLNRKIKRYRKPYVAIMDGIVMGGGVGVSIHGSLRIATERTVFAMPETGIGLFPDVGATYFLPRLRSGAGMWLGLTGSKLRADQVCEAGICEDLFHSSKLSDFIEALADGQTWLQRNDSYELDSYQLRPDYLGIDYEQPERLQWGKINRFAYDSLQEILDDNWLDAERKTILSKSPTSTRIAFRQIREGATLDFEDCMRLEYRLARYCMTHPDFYEGVRAVILDKDNAPQWSPSTLEEATDDFIAEAFAPLGPDELHFD